MTRSGTPLRTPSFAPPPPWARVDSRPAARPRPRWSLLVAGLVAGVVAAVVPVLLEGGNTDVRPDATFWVALGVAAVGGAIAIALGVIGLVAVGPSGSDGAMAVAIIAIVAGSLAWILAAMLLFAG